jgi:hypothetical protein
MTKEEVLYTIDSKIRIKASDYHFINDASRCIRDALKLKLTKIEKDRIKGLEKTLNKIEIVNHREFDLSYNEPILEIMHELESILQE